MKAVMFPGQGAQRPGMGATLFPRYAEILARADAILGFSLAEVCRDRPDLLGNTRYTQPALFVVSVLSYLDDETEHGPPDLLAGHSVGEFAALTAAGVLTFEQGLQLVNRRALAMAAVSGGGMAAILGAPRHRVEQLLGESALDLELANVNSPTQTVVAGLRSDIDKLVAWSAGKDFRVVPLRVSGAFHTRWMRPATQDFVAEIERLDFRPPRIPVVSNVSGTLHGTDIRAAMARHLTSPVLWQKSVETMLDFGITDFVELGPAKVLSPLVDEIRTAHARAAGMRASEATRSTGWLPEFSSPNRLIDAPAPVAACLAELSHCYVAPPPTIGQRLAWFERFCERWAKEMRSESMPALAPISALQSDQSFRQTLRAFLDKCMASAQQAAPARPFN